eukprot:INCI16661.1.p1 GENE.INCI16661.1~~INCI16661.1.p1  ORF type:complete len:649 (+),score=121.52 INCI16661.1:206-1948(+)
MCSTEDSCPYDGENDADGDGKCGNVDACPYDAENDVDRDSLCGNVDSCPYDAKNDIDGDAFCADVDCLKTCYGQNCDFWISNEFMTCSALEDSYSCECGGCVCDDPAPEQCDDTCWDFSCDFWISEYSVGCDELESSYGCSCEGCLCRDDFACPSDGKCAVRQFEGDGYCDDNNNNCGCDWDGGDCCGPTNSYKTCDACECLDPNYVCHDGAASPAQNCQVFGWVADGVCDDVNNKCACSWDGGDCCGSTNKYNHCSAYKSSGNPLDCCLDPDAELPPAGCDGFCKKLGLKGDGYCDDTNNVCGCDWDGGDCCGADRNLQFCKECQCLDPDDTTCSAGFSGPGKCEIVNYAGDGMCDDGNNNCGCNWDGGDCCLAPVAALYCEECTCLDPDVVSDPTKYCAGGGTCGALAWEGDGFCDDANNNCGCGWDGGDCCGSILVKYCSDCECLDPDEVSWDATYCSGTCGAPSAQADRMCDSSNNNCGCSWDGGDCCGDQVVPRAKLSNECANDDTGDCACLDPDFVAPTCPKAPASLKCAALWLEDGICDDSNNNCKCGWDGGDCCSAGASYLHCTECVCYDAE